MIVNWNKHARALQINAQALKTASKIVTSQVCRGFVCVDTKVRCEGRLLEWFMDNGDLIEIYKRIDYSSGVAVHQSTSVRHYRQNTDGDEFEILFEKNFNK